MKKQILASLIATSLLIAVPLQPLALAQQTQKEYKLSQLLDVPRNHWAYKAVKYLLEELQIMAPKYDIAFLGNLNLTRYELAEIFYKAMKRLESENEVDLTKLSKLKPQSITDSQAKYRQMVEAVVNQYGIMLLIQGKFHGDISISRYEMAFELANYFNLIEKSAEKKCKISSRSRAIQLRDLDPFHWTYAAVKGVIDDHQLMDGYDDGTFRGDKALSRFEGAAVISKFVKYIDTCYDVKPDIKPTPKPTPLPTPLPTPTPVPRQHSQIFEIVTDLPAQIIEGENPLSPYPPYITGVQGQASIWFGQFPVGFSLGGEYLWSDAGLAFLNQSTATIDYNSRWRFNQTLNLRLWGAKYQDEFKWMIGVGNDFSEFAPKAGFTRFLRGPFVKSSMLIPLGTPYIALALDASFAHYNNWNVWDTAAILGNMRADGFLGLALPAYGWGSFRVGANIVYYSMPHLNQNFSVLEIGPVLGFKLAF